ncbi:MAG: carbohydrate-binding domain-containing protein [Oscillospiraceae bacterium]|nr:carbohydrate-binding domain-containing protein [Oscillospiraceae bacterium]
MKKTRLLSAILALAMTFTACTAGGNDPGQTEVDDRLYENATQIVLSDSSITVDGETATNDLASAVYTARDIVYYESGRDFTYGEGSESDAHSAEDAAAHTVVHITQPGAYCISGTLTRGQIAVDLGEDAKDDPTAVVTLIFSGADITCTVAPAVIFYRVYECSNDDADSATKDVDTSAAGANVIIADGTVNNIAGAYVARIYESGSVVLNEDGTEVEDADKLHKYDGAFYSRMSMNIGGGKENTGVLNITADNEGLDSELHLTINGGNINIFSGNDGINTNEDGVSVTTVNGGTLNIRVTGETGEGDGIDSNGWLVINGGTVIAAACSTSADAGIDSDMGIHINGGTVIASGHMLDRIEDGGQTYAVFSFAQEQRGADEICLKNEAGESLLTLCPQNNYSILIYSSSDLIDGTYTMWSGGTQLKGQSSGMMGEPGTGGMPDRMPDGAVPPEIPEGQEPPEGGERPNGQQPPTDGEHPEGSEPPEPPDGENGDRQFPGGFDHNANGNPGDYSTDFEISDGANMFSSIAPN